jgi:diguanylate cyclase (GGDEF)-like protein/PAS domain S-box-containing protein
MNKSGLLVRLAVVIAFSSLAVSFISAQLFYRITYLNEVEVAHQEVKQLYQTVQATASVAAYIVDKELATEVVNGLKTNDIVLDASISTDQGLLSTPIFKPGESQDKFLLYSPFEKSKQIGTLTIVPNLDYIEKRAEQLGENNSLALIAQAFIVTIVAIYIAYTLITMPMVISASKLHKIKPGTPDRLKVPDFHDKSELGLLVRDVNALLDKTEKQISEERRLRNDIEVLEKRFRMLFENATSPIVLMEPRGSILLHNNAFHDMLEANGTHFKKNYGPLLSELFESPEQLNQSIQKAFSNDEIATGEFKLKSSDSAWVQVVASSIVSDDLKEYYQITLHDISKRKKELELLSRRADFDQLTQLQNRHSLEKNLQQLINEKTPFALVMLDLDGFKQINDIYGHESGDEILIHIAGVFKKSLRAGDLACRWGGDEFVLVFKHINKAELIRQTDKLIAKVRKPYYLSKNENEVSVGASMGVAFFPENELNLQALLQQADQAMYTVKKGTNLPKDKFLVFSDDISQIDQS